MKVTKRKRINSNTKITYDIDQIKEELRLAGQNELMEMVDVSKAKEYMYIEKLITFADVVGYGKGNYGQEKKTKEFFEDDAIKERTKRNYLFYATDDEIYEYEKRNKRNKVFFCEAHQTCISMPMEFYRFIGLHGTSRNNKGVSLNEGKYHTFLVNKSIIDYFDEDTTNRLLEKFGKEKLAKGVTLSKDRFTPIKLHIAAHGLGTAKDEVFHMLRGNIFAKDRLSILVAKTEDEINIFVLLYRNTKFYISLERELPIYIFGKHEAEDEKHVESRSGQTKWRDTLADLAMTNCINDTDKVRCPFTKIEVSYPSEGTLLRASHILAYGKCKNSDGTIDIEKAYDPENGFLVTANVDALFDKYLITVEPKTKRVRVSDRISEKLVFNDLGIVRKIDDIEISEKKEKYLEMHYETFLEKEKKN